MKKSKSRTDLVTAGTQEEKIELLKKLGILSPEGKTIVQKWKGPSRTPTYEELYESNDD